MSIRLSLNPKFKKYKIHEIVEEHIFSSILSAFINSLFLSTASYLNIFGKKKNPNQENIYKINKKNIAIKNSLKAWLVNNKNIDDKFSDKLNIRNKGIIRNI